jgi:site-specific recombinase XerD
MLEKYFNSPARLQGLLGSPLGISFERFAQELSDAGYAQFTARSHLRAAKRFIDWAGSKGVPIASVDEAVVECFDRHLTHCRCPHYGHRQRIALLQGARLFLGHLRRTGLIMTPVPAPADPVLLVAFRRWMEQQRGTCDSTLELYRRPVLDFLKCLGEDPARFDAQGLRQFVLQRRQRGGGAVQTCTTALRAFCHFLSAEGRCSRDLVAAIPTIARWRLSSLPRYLPPEEVERVVTASKIDAPVGRRDYAILLLLARLGLRAGDIVQLRLSDIDWDGAWIQVSGKSRRLTRFPLTRELGEALAAYLQDGRPQSDATTVFVRARVPFRAFASHQAVTHIVDRALRRAGVIRPSRGAAHLLRHSLATALLRNGASLQDIADILRHRCVTTTQIYAKVDVNALQQIAQPWPGALSC